MAAEPLAMREAAEELRALTVKEIAAATARHVGTVQADIRAGCPVVRRGEVGRGRGALLDLEAYRQWLLRRAGIRAELDIVSRVLFASIGPLRKRARAGELATLEYVLLTFRAIADELLGRPITEDELPPEMTLAAEYFLHLRSAQLRAAAESEGL